MGYVPGPEIETRRRAVCPGRASSSTFGRSFAIHAWTALAVAIPVGIIAVFLMSVALRARHNKVVTGEQGLIGEIGVAFVVVPLVLRRYRVLGYLGLEVPAGRIQRSVEQASFERLRKIEDLHGPKRSGHGRS